jgi:hypothetical protein
VRFFDGVDVHFPAGICAEIPAVFYFHVFSVFYAKKADVFFIDHFPGKFRYGYTIAIAYAYMSACCSGVHPHKLVGSEQYETDPVLSRSGNRFMFLFHRRSFLL